MGPAQASQHSRRDIAQHVAALTPMSSRALACTSAPCTAGGKPDRIYPPTAWSISRPLSGPEMPFFQNYDCGPALIAWDSEISPSLTPVSFSRVALPRIAPVPLAKPNGSLTYGLLPAGATRDIGRGLQYGVQGKVGRYIYAVKIET